MKRMIATGLALAAALADLPAEAQTSPAPGRYAATASDEPQTLPRISPRDLLPRSWFGAGETAAPSPVADDVAPGADGTTRARLMRDLRRSDAVEIIATDDRRPQPRAGSVLSADAPVTGAEGASFSAKNSRLARSIAAEAAEAISDSNNAPPVRVAPAGRPAPEENPEPVDKPPFTLEPAAPVLPAPQGAAVGPRGRVSVAANPSSTTKLPMFIGEAFSKPESFSTFAAPSAVAGQRMAKTPTKAPSQPGEPVEDDLLFTQRMPALVSKVAGPRTIVVGREANYRVLVANRGDVAADEVETVVVVPASAEVVGSKASSGVVEPAGEPGRFLWKASRLAAGEVVKLDLRLVARSGEPVELAVTHHHRPVDGRTLVEVQQPMLALDLTGPGDVLFGRSQVFRLTITNPGTGVAENVVLHLTPPGGDAAKRTTHDLGSIAAGEERAVEIELTAREAGRLAIAASALADGGLSADVSKEVLCRRAQLAVDVRGPADRYADSPATYVLRVSNPGTAPASDVVLDVELPAGFEPAVGPDAGPDSPAVDGGRLVYRVGALREGEQRVFELRGVLRQAGTGRLVAAASGADEARSEPAVTTTEVVALADLKLDVLDPKGPVATDQEVAYEIRVTNRGANDAHDVRVIGLFSEGIEPHHVEGAPSKVNDGRVAFDTIDRVAAGEERTFTIYARAHTEGTHLFRAEVLCRDLEIKLAAEETTRFFKDEAIEVAAEGYPSGPSISR